MFSKMKSFKLYGETGVLICLITIGLVYRSPSKFEWSMSTLGVCLVYTLSVIVFRKKSTKSQSNQLILPEVKYLPFKIPFLDGLITVIKFHLEGPDLFGSLSKKYGLSFVVPLALTKVVVITEPEKLQAILGTSNENTLNKPQYLYKMVLTDSIQNGLIAAPYPVWFNHRRAVSAAFSYKGIAACLRFINNGAQKLIEEIDLRVDTIGSVQNVTVQKQVDKVALRIISDIILGTESSNPTDHERETFLGNINKANELSAERLQSPLQILPFVWMVHPNKREIERRMNKARKYVYKLIDTYKNENPAANPCSTAQIQEATPEDDCLGVKPFKCLLPLLINSKLTRREITDEVVTFFAAGHDTIVTAIGFLVLHLASHADIQNKCRKEVRGILESKQGLGSGARSLTMEDCSNLKYLERCILEAMRLTPPIPLILRWIEKPLEILPGEILDGNQTILVNIGCIHRDKTIYPDPLKFNPDRFLPEEIKKRPLYSFLPFSMGARNCIGWKIALTELKVVMARLLNSYELTTTEKLSDLGVNFNITLKTDRTPNITFTKVQYSK